jgi:flagellar biosynthesis chaperone FliJ
MLRKIILIVGILAALAAAVLNFTVVKGKIDILTTDRNSQRDQKVQAQNDLRSTRKTLKETQDTLDQTKVQLADAVKKRQDAEDNLAKANTQIDDLQAKVTKTTQERDDAQNQLEAFKSSGLTPKQVADLNKTLTQTESALAVANEEKLVMTHAIARLQNQIDDLVGNNHPVLLPAALKGEVMAVDPKWDFVVLNVGEDQGVLQNGELLISRDGKLVAKVIVRSVQRDRSIANLVPGWKLGDVFEGDQAIPAHPSS